MAVPLNPVPSSRGRLFNYTVIGLVNPCYRENFP